MFEVWYIPKYSTFTRECKRISASSKKQAEIKFYLTKEGDNCIEIIDII